MSFKIGSRFVKAASLVNVLPVEKFPLLLSRILSKLHLKEAFFNAQVGTVIVYPPIHTYTDLYTHYTRYYTHLYTLYPLL
jgi:hypothetical protein